MRGLTAFLAPLIRTFSLHVSSSKDDRKLIVRHAQHIEWEFREVCVLRKVSYLLGRDGRDGRQGPAGPRGLTGPKGSRIPDNAKGVVRFIEFSKRVFANSSGTVEPGGSQYGGLRLLCGKSPQALYFESLVSPPPPTTTVKKYIPLPLLIPSY